MITEEKVVTYHCDICKRKSGVKMANVGVPHYFLTEQTEGTFLKTPRLETKTMDLCKGCVEKVVVVEGVGAQGYNQYRFISEN